MAKYQITAPDGSNYEVEAPDTATEQEVLAYAQNNFQPAQEQPKYDPTEGMSGYDKFMAGAGKGAVDMYRGLKQVLPFTDKAVLEKEIAESRVLDAPLMKSGYAKAGNIVGTAAPFVAASAIPGTQGYLAQMALGGVMGATQPTLQGESRALNVALGAGGGAAGKYLGDKVGAIVSGRLAKKSAEKATEKAQSAVRDATLAEAKKAGYVVPPSYAKSGVGSRILEGVSGKYKTNQLATIKNEAVTDKLVRQSLGLPDDAPISLETLGQMRKEAFDVGYEPLRGIGQVKTDKTLLGDLNSISAKYIGASRSFPGAVKNPIPDLVDNYKVNEFDAGDAIDAIKVLRGDADSAFRAGNNELGKANREIANALENQLERSAPKNAGALVNQFRESRKLIAKTHSIENAFNEATGKVDAKKLAAQLKKGKPLSGELKTAAKFGQAFPDVAGMPKSGNANPFTILDVGVGGYGIGAANPYLMALPPARAAARYTILSKPYQNAFVKPGYSVPLNARLPDWLLNNDIAKAGIAAGIPAGLLAYPGQQ